MNPASPAKRVAVVEDNPDNRLLVRVILESAYQVSEYESGPGALEGIERETPDLLLLDISLPEMDGVEVLRRVRANPQLSGLPVIALTAHAMSGDREKYMALGFNDYVTKPIVDEAVLIQTIERTLDGAAPRGAIRTDGQLNSGAIERLRKLGGDSFAAEMIGVFLEYAGKKVGEVVEACAAGNFAVVEQAAHPVKSSAGNVGAAQVQELAARIEAAAKNPPHANLQGMVQELKQAFESAKPRFEEIQNTLKPK